MARRAPGAEQDHNHRQRKGIQVARAASVPIQRERPMLELVTRRKHPSTLSSMNSEDVTSSSLPSIVVVRGRKRDLSSLASPQADPIGGTSTIVADPSADASGKSSRKKAKRSTSTPPAPKSSQIAIRVKSRTRSQSRAGSPSVDLEYVPPTRISARLARKTHPFIISRSSDIYTHLADPNGGGNLLNDPPTGSIMLSTPIDSGGSRLAKKPRGRPRKTNLTDENVRNALMEEWAQIRRSQGALPLSERDEHMSASQDGVDFLSPSQLGAITPRSSPRPEGSSSQATTVVDVAFTQETLVDLPSKDLDPSPLPHTQQGFGDDFPSELEVTPHAEVFDSDIGTNDVGPAEIPPLSTLHTGPLSTASPLSHLPEELHSPASPMVLNQPSQPQIPSSPKPIASPAQNRTTDSDAIEQAVNPFCDPSEENHSTTQPTVTHPLDGGDTYLEDDAEFHLLEVPEVFTLPWEPEASHIYVPPGLGKLISGKWTHSGLQIDLTFHTKGMRGQLTTEARARRRAEELYQTEMKKRIAAEQVIRDLRALLANRVHSSSRELLADPQNEASLIT